ncbi:hypothetical protein MOQ72_15055 [Saccharopolyspora sp. K220]|uniref:zinc finger protein n=1 Tax=Saccharopolyspora soli TaxID=2926618 RepID=UPI001F5A4EA5|nr:zinc finger protein [Saccharopolyspora soli]MCI2418758.1 hypothetical protein [Saccharopolyspora soli]
MYAFHWVPADGQRHASTDERPCGCSYPTGTQVMTLCWREVVADNSELAWLWATCPDCDIEVRRLAGVARS